MHFLQVSYLMQDLAIPQKSGFLKIQSSDQQAQDPYSIWLNFKQET